MELQESEVVTLVLGFASILTLMSIFWKKEMQKLQLFYAGFIFIICAYIFTVVEGIFWSELFNQVKQMSYALAGILFAAACRSLMLHLESDEVV